MGALFQQRRDGRNGISRCTGRAVLSRVWLHDGRTNSLREIARHEWCGDGARGLLLFDMRGVGHYGD